MFYFENLTKVSTLDCERDRRADRERKRDLGVDIRERLFVLRVLFVEVVSIVVEQFGRLLSLLLRDGHVRVRRLRLPLRLQRLTIRLLRQTVRTLN